MFEVALEVKRTARVWIKENWTKTFPGKFVLIASEVLVHGSLCRAEDMRGYGWRIDFMARNASRPYLIECDINKSSQDIWHTFKIIGYKAAYCIDWGLDPKTIGTMVMLHERQYNHRVRNILAYSKIEFCVFSEDNESWKMVRSSLWK